jgi:CRP-like cAMP-binding protein
MRDGPEGSTRAFARDERDEVAERKRRIDDASAAMESTAARPDSNRLLRALPPSSYARLAPHLEPLRLAHKDVIWEPDKPIRWVYFPQNSVCSLLVPLAEAAPVEAATVGREGFAGVPIVLGADATSTLAVAQVPGDAMRVSVDALRDIIAEDRILLSLLLRYAQALQEQTAQSVACNGRHSLDERCARWLLMTHDRVGGDEFHLSHKFLAQMLGVRRASVTVAAGMLQQAGLIRYNRATVVVLDREGLEQASCECYGIVKAKYDRLLA